MTLCQFYDQECKKLGFNSWNAYCAFVTLKEKEITKKDLKRIYKINNPEKQEKKCQASAAQTQI